PAAPANRTHLRERERSLVDRDRARPTATGADVGRGARLRAAAAAHRALRLRGEIHRGGHAVDRIEEREFQLGLQIRPSPRPRAPSATPAAPAPAADEIAEHVAEPSRIAEVAGLEAEPTRKARAAGTDARRDQTPDLVVLLAAL